MSEARSPLEPRLSAPAIDDLLAVQYWPVAGSAGLVADGPALALRVLGVDMAAFRDSAGRLGVLEQACPHVGKPKATLVTGANAGGGLRCKYHGWKFDVTGACTNVPDLPPGNDIVRYMRARSYPVVESGGIVWVSIGGTSTADGQPLAGLPLAVAGGHPRPAVEAHWSQALAGDPLSAMAYPYPWLALTPGNHPQQVHATIAVPIDAGHTQVWDLTCLIPARESGLLASLPSTAAASLQALLAITTH